MEDDRAPKYEYHTVNVSDEPDQEFSGRLRPASIESASNNWARKGWRVVCVMPKRGLGYSDCLLIEREVAHAGSD